MMLLKGRLTARIWNYELVLTFKKQMAETVATTITC